MMKKKHNLKQNVFEFIKYEKKLKSEINGCFILLVTIEPPGYEILVFMHFKTKNYKYA